MAKVAAVLRRHIWVLVIATVLGIIVGVLSSLGAPKAAAKSTYRAEQVIVAVGDQGSNANIEQDALRFTRGSVVTKAAEILHSTEAASSLARKLTVVASTDSRSITIASTDDNEQTAVDRVDAFAQAFIQLDSDLQRKKIDDQITLAKSDVEALQRQLTEFDAAHPTLATDKATNPFDPALLALVSRRQELENGRVAAAELVNRASAQRAQTQRYTSLGKEEAKAEAASLINVPSSLAFRAGVLGLLGFVLGLGLIFILERNDDRIDTRAELADAVHLPILAEVGFVKKKKRSLDESGAITVTGPWAEEYRRLRSAVQFVTASERRDQSATSTEPAPSNGSQVFMVSSITPGEGKSTSTALLSLALAQVGEPTVVVGGDFRRPQIQTLLGVKASPSLQDLTAVQRTPENLASIVQNTIHRNLAVIASGPPNRETGSLIDVVKDIATLSRPMHGTIVIDASPFDVSNDPIDLLPAVDWVILVVRAGRITRADLTRVLEILDRMDTKVLGFVLVGATRTGKLQEYYYDTYGSNNPNSEHSKDPDLQHRRTPTTET